MPFMWPHEVVLNSNLTIGISGSHSYPLLNEVLGSKRTEVGDGQAGGRSYTRGVQ